MASHTSDVLSTPELLEQILAELPMLDLLVTAPLVCKPWHALSLSSPTLQRALFFQPDSSVSVSQRIQNPLLVKLFPPFFVCNTGSHPISTLDAIMAMPWSKAPDAFRRADASWRRMLVTQPPTHSLVVRQKFSSIEHISRRQGVVNDLSLSMGLLYDLTIPFLDDESSFRVLWHGESPHDSAADDSLTLSLFTAARWEYDGPERTLDTTFFSAAASPIFIPFGEWERLCSK
ncbi:putative MFS transporter [Favolaschia claudopus]|uniref:MFS transporter n=1 Tax=Favolaschia claudopus TaxID=2862362 RepID=A0AAW0DAE5_9AGAR